MRTLRAAALAAFAEAPRIVAALVLAVRVFIHIYFYVMAAAFVVVSLVMVARGVAAAVIASNTPALAIAVIRDMVYLLPPAAAAALVGTAAAPVVRTVAGRRAPTLLRISIPIRPRPASAVPFETPARPAAEERAWFGGDVAFGRRRRERVHQRPLHHDLLLPTVVKWPDPKLDHRWDRWRRRDALRRRRREQLVVLLRRELVYREVGGTRFTGRARWGRHGVQGVRVERVFRSGAPPRVPGGRVEEWLRSDGTAVWWPPPEPEYLRRRRWRLGRLKRRGLNRWKRRRRVLRRGA